jgi:hypothetical protein
MRRTLLPTIFGLGLLPARASAQLCRGLPGVERQYDGARGRGRVLRRGCQGIRGAGDVRRTVEALGLTTDVSPTVSVTPFAESALVYARVDVGAGLLGEGSGDEWAGPLHLGLGVGFNDRLTLRPSVSLPISYDDELDGDTVFNVGVAIGLGG